MGKWFVVFVKAGTEDAVVKHLLRHLEGGRYLPFVLTKEVLHRVGGSNQATFKKPLFPGYVIVSTENSPDEVLDDFAKIIFGNIHRILNRGNDKKDIMLHESEQSRWESLVDSDFCINISTGVLDGKKVIVTHGPLVGKEDQIVKLNKYKQKAILKVEFAGEMVDMSFVLRIQKGSQVNHDQ